MFNQHVKVAGKQVGENFKSMRACVNGLFFPVCGYQPVSEV